MKPVAARPVRAASVESEAGSCPTCSEFLMKLKACRPCVCETWCRQHAPRELHTSRTHPLKAPLLIHLPNPSF